MENEALQYPCKIDMFPIENMAFSRRCSFPSLSRWRSALRELQKSSIRSSRAESGEGNLVVDPKLPWTMSDFFQWFGILIFFFLEMILHWFFFGFWWMLSNDFSLQWFAPRDVCFRWHHTTHLEGPELRVCWKKKKQHKVQQIVSNFWFTAAEKKVTHEKIMKTAAKNEACRMLISPQPTPMCRHNLTSSTPGRREIPWNQTYLVALWQNTKPVSNIWSLLWISIQHADLGFSKLRNTWHFSTLLYLHGSCNSKTSWNLACHARSTAVAMGPASTKWSSCMSGSFLLHIKQE